VRNFERHQLTQLQVVGTEPRLVNSRVVGVLMILTQYNYIATSMVLGQACTAMLSR
jgi:hypothetical protein